MPIYQTDGVYLVRVDYERSRDRYRVRGFFRGHRDGTIAGTSTRSEASAYRIAEALWSQYRRGDLDAPECAPETLRELVEAFCARETSSRGGPLSANTRRAYRSHLSTLLSGCGESCSPHNVTRAHIRRAVDAPASLASKASYLRSCRALFTWAIRQDFVADNPCDGVTTAPPPRVLRPYLQPAEVDAFLAACRPSIRARAALILRTGLRVGEAMHLRWSWIQRGVGRPSIRVPAEDVATGWRTKSHQARAIPLSSAAQSALDEARELWPDGPWVLHDEPEPLRSSSNWARDVRLACARAGCTRIDTHGLRRTAGLLWLVAGVSIFDVSRLLGHSSVVVTERSYAGFCDRTWAGVMDCVDTAAELPSLRVPSRVPMAKASRKVRK